jgi:hypothetical protein
MRSTFVSNATQLQGEGGEGWGGAKEGAEGGKELHPKPTLQTADAVTADAVAADDGAETVCDHNGGGVGASEGTGRARWRISGGGQRRWGGGL